MRDILFYDRAIRVFPLPLIDAEVRQRNTTVGYYLHDAIEVSLACLTNIHRIPFIRRRSLFSAALLMRQYDLRNLEFPRLVRRLPVHPQSICATPKTATPHFRICAQQGRDVFTRFTEKRNRRIRCRQRPSPPSTAFNAANGTRRPQGKAIVRSRAPPKACATPKATKPPCAQETHRWGLP